MEPEFQVHQADAAHTAGARQEPSATPRVRRRRVIKAAGALGAAAAGLSGYIQPSVRPLQLPVAHAFSF
jgi:hypothetical protein